VLVGGLHRQVEANPRHKQLEASFYTWLSTGFVAGGVVPLVVVPDNLRPWRYRSATMATRPFVCLHMERAVNEDEIRKTFGEKVRRGMFRSVERHLPDLCREERMAEGLALTFELFRKKALDGELLDDALLVHACRLRAIDCTRCLVRQEGCERGRDVLELRNFWAGKVEVLHLDGVLGEDEEQPGDGDPTVEAAALDAVSTNPTARIISAISLGEWLEHLEDSEVKLMALRLQGFTLGELASELGLGVTTVCHRLHRLGEQLAAHAHLPVPRRPRRARDGSSTGFTLAAA